MLMSLGRIAMAENSTLGTCLWCGRGFTPRATGGKTQRFCRPRCRRAFDAAGRRWIAVALTSGALTIAHLKSPLKNDLRATRALLPGAVSPVAVPPGEGLLTERTAGVQPVRRERVFMPRS